MYRDNVFRRPHDVVRSLLAQEEARLAEIKSNPGLGNVESDVFLCEQSISALRAELNT